MKMFDPLYSILKDIETPVFKSIINNLKQEISINTKKIRERAETLSQEYEKMFPTENDSVISDTILNILFKIPLLFHLYGINGSAIVELYSILEIIIKREIVDCLDVDNTMKSGIERIVERRSLTILAKDFTDLLTLSKADHDIIAELNILRNSVVHKDSKRLSKIPGFKFDPSRIEINLLMSDIKFSKYLFGSVNIIKNLSKDST